jgi:membrane protein implicated in regulation of membrane protease activity
VTPRQKIGSPWLFIVLGLILLGLEQLTPGQSIPVQIIGGAFFTVGLAGLMFGKNTSD